MLVFVSQPSVLSADVLINDLAGSLVLGQTQLVSYLVEQVSLYLVQIKLYIMVLIINKAKTVVDLTVHLPHCLNYHALPFALKDEVLKSKLFISQLSCLIVELVSVLVELSDVFEYHIVQYLVLKGLILNGHLGIVLGDKDQTIVRYLLPVI